ncbi:hypothetical protein N7492_009407 [Penicillium capsulatum]|uniref:Major facilitator superfamily (MFS) profile domain-containing protein n=1 Tax=Penicillium capsulatum TaxID=69766 RepID=A0A9W9HX24_9EURO|nr:hypothetical protein N7492_009407 [Penicillium capsulatum]KAJ6106800.1 hypothetical protein N7512_010317 [Penicillium capsulatum]
MEETRQEPWLGKFRSSETFIVVVVSIAIFTDAFIYGMIIPIIPIALVDRAGAREEDAQSWVSILLAVYGGTLLIGSPLFGWFADQSRLRRLPFVFGLIALGASTALFVLARSMPILIIARGLQGLSAAAVWVVGLAIVSENVAPERVGEAMGHTTIALTWGFLLGPVIGGMVYEKVGYYATFILPAGLIVVDIVMRFAMIEKSAMSLRSKHGYCSEAACSDNAVYHTFSSQEEQRSGHRPTSRENSGEQDPLLTSPDTIHGSNSTERSPGTILHLLQTARLPLALVATVVMAMFFAALESTLPLFVMDTFHWASGGTGLLLVVLSLPSLAGIYIGKAINKIGVRILSASGFALAAVSWIVTALVRYNTPEDMALLVVLLLTFGLAIVMIEVSAMTEVSQVISDHEEQFPGVFGEKSPVAQAYALFNMAFAGGQLLGPLLAGYLRVQAGWTVMTSVLGLICGLTALLLGLFGGPTKRNPPIENEEETNE